MEQINLSSIAVVFAFATLNESLIEYLFGSMEVLRPYLPILALLTAVFFNIHLSDKYYLYAFRCRKRNAFSRFPLIWIYYF